MTLPPNLVHEVSYPGDIGAIANICYGRFNTRSHQCGNNVAFLAPVVADRHASKEMVIVGEPGGDIRQSLDATGWSAYVVEDYRGLAYHVIKWIEQDSAAFFPSLMDDSFRKLSLRERAEKVSPIQLLGLKMARDGCLSVLVAPRDDPSATPVPASGEDLVNRLDRLGVEETIEQLKRVVQLAIFDGFGGELEAAVARHVPVECLDSGVLDGLAGEARSGAHVGHPEHVQKVHHLLVTCAVAHRLAGCDNPAVTQLAAFLAEIYQLKQLDNVELDERFWLKPQQLRRLLDAGSVLGAAAELGTGDQRGLLNPQFHEFLELLGWSDLILGITVKVPDYERVALGEIDVGLFAQSLLEFATEQQGEGWDDWDLGQLTAAGAFQMMRTNLPIDEHELIDCIVEGLTERASPLALLAFHAGIIQHANRAYRTDLAVAAASAALKDFSAVDAGSKQTVDVLVEVGNTFRGLERWDDALRLYDQAAKFNRLVPEGHAEREAVLARNRALVLRDAGRFGEAETLLEDHARAYPDDCEAQESLMLLYERVGRREEALTLVDEQLTRTDLSPYDSSRFRLLRALLRAQLKQHDAAAADCQAAIAVRDNLWERLQVQQCALLTDPTEEPLAAFVADCERHAVEILDGPYLGNPTLAISAATLAALRRLRSGRVAQAGEVIEKITVWLDVLTTGGPWQFELAVGWHALETGAPDAFDHLTTAIAKLDATLPMAPEADYAVGALSDYAIEDLQRLAARAGVAAIVANRSSPAHLVPVLDVANARDLTARANTNASIAGAGPATVDALDRWQDLADVDVVALVDDTSTLQLLLEPTGRSRRLVDTAIPVTELRAAVRTLKKFDRTNPLFPETMDAHLMPWWELAAVIASTLRRELPGERELVVVPCRMLVATPLHAAGWPGRPLIADRPVSVTPNHRLLTGQRIGAELPYSTASYGLIAVPKATDNSAFTQRLSSFVERFRTRAPNAQVVSAAEADEAASLAVLGGSEVVLVLCHGVHGGSSLGPGICVAADGLLPPEQLDVEADPDLADFVLSWDDIVKLPRSPDVLVSIACSSGRTVVSSGGSRLGLEQGSLANATRFVVAPLWPVEQHTSLAWVEGFLEPALAAPATGLSLQNVPQMHQAATLALAERHPHPYHWAPFALTTALRGGIP